MTFYLTFVGVLTEAKNGNFSYIFDLRLHVIAKSGNGSQEIAGRLQNNSLCQTNMSLGGNRKTLFDETFCFL